MTNQEQAKIVEDYLRTTIEQVLLGFGDEGDTEEELEDAKLLSEMVSNLVVHALDLKILETNGEMMTASLVLRKDDEWMDSWADAIEERLGPL